MKFVTYASTPDLDRFPKPDRFRLWRSIHKTLMKTDAGYRQRVHGFVRRIVAVVIAFVLLSLVLGRLPWPPLGVQLAVYVVLTAMYVSYLLFISFSLQQFQNEKVGKALHTRRID